MEKPRNTSTMYDETARSCLKAFKNFHEMLIDLLMEDEQHSIVYSSEFFVLLKENMGYCELIEKPLQTLIERLAEKPILSDNTPKIHYVEYPNGHSNSREFDYAANQSTFMMGTKHVTGEIHEYTNSFQQRPFQNGHETGDYSSGYGNRDQNETSNATVLSTNSIDQSLIEPQCNGQCRYNFEEFVPTDGQFVASHPSNIRQSREDQMNGQGVNSFPNELAMDSSENTIFSMQQSTETTQERRQCVDAENICRHQYTDDLSCGGNYKLVMEAIEQLENENKSDQQPVNIQSTDITTTIDTQMDTPAREHLEAASIHQTVHTGNENIRMDASALEQPSNHKKSRREETLNVPVLSSDVIEPKRDLTKRPGDKKPAIVRNTRSNTKKMQGETDPIGQPKVVLTDLIYTVGKEKLAEYRSAANKKQLAIPLVLSRRRRQLLKNIDAPAKEISEEKCWGGFWKKKFPYGASQG